jgi:hypothetical protein
MSTNVFVGVGVFAGEHVGVGVYVSAEQWVGGCRCVYVCMYVSRVRKYVRMLVCLQKRVGVGVYVSAVECVTVCVCVFCVCLATCSVVCVEDKFV